MSSDVLAVDVGDAAVARGGSVVQILSFSCALFSCYDVIQIFQFLLCMCSVLVC
jgi:hypothetical protein